jgi:hypothetical protein
MHKEILSEKQIELFPRLKNFSDKFGLLGDKTGPFGGIISVESVRKFLLENGYNPDQKTCL